MRLTPAPNLSVTRLTLEGRSPAPVPHVLGDGDIRNQVGLGDRLPGREAERQPPGPVGRIEVALLVARGALPDLGRGLLDLNGRHRGGLHVLLVRTPDLVRATRRDVLDDRPECPLRLVWIGHLATGAED